MKLHHCPPPGKILLAIPWKKPLLAPLDRILAAPMLLVKFKHITLHHGTIYALVSFVSSITMLAK